MEVILKEDMQPLGFKDDVVAVKNGYGRNFLIPQGKAVLATESAKKMHAETIKQRAKKDAKLKADAETVATKIEALTLKVSAKAGDSGKIFGSINNIQIAEALKLAGVDVDRKAIKVIGGSPKELGSFEAEAKLHREVTSTFTFEIIAG
ncbi:50S ribosomal protein L9 [Flavobacteriales bacterium]|jgi:large subunit ribosomal protein L9|nr:50S ribosomal protein L9 [Flavobacteriales bacterium]MDG1517045.1 50S ribosomal protein L9 [Flavobacteriales bacterium]